MEDPGVGVADGAGLDGAPDAVTLHLRAGDVVEVRGVLACSAIASRHAFCRRELASLATGPPPRRVVHCITRDPPEIRADSSPRGDGDVVSESLEGIHPVAAYPCGPPAKVESASDALVDLGVDPEVIESETYG